MKSDTTLTRRQQSTTADYDLQIVCDILPLLDLCSPKNVNNEKDYNNKINQRACTLKKKGFVIAAFNLPLYQATQ